jgi:hypothetical protein
MRCDDADCICVVCDIDHGGCENADWFSGSTQHEELYNHLSDCKLLS